MWHITGNLLLWGPLWNISLTEINKLPGGIVVDFTQDVSTAPVFRGEVTASHQQVNKGRLTHRYFSCNYIIRKLIGRKKIIKAN